jgi:hypothetical protein
MGEQLHAGTVHGSKTSDGTSLWHTGKRDGKAGYWCGNWHYRTPQELLAECESTIADLLKNHPDLKQGRVTK